MKERKSNDNNDKKEKRKRERKNMNFFASSLRKRRFHIDFHISFRGLF